MSHDERSWCPLPGESHLVDPLAVSASGLVFGSPVRQCTLDVEVGIPTAARGFAFRGSLPLRKCYGSRDLVRSDPRILACYFGIKGVIDETSLPLSGISKTNGFRRLSGLESSTLLSPNLCSLTHSSIRVRVVRKLSLLSFVTASRASRGC